MLHKARGETGCTHASPLPQRACVLARDGSAASAERCWFGSGVEMPLEGLVKMQARCDPCHCRRTHTRRCPELMHALHSEQSLDTAVKLDGASAPAQLASCLWKLHHLPTSVLHRCKCRENTTSRTRDVCCHAPVNAKSSCSREKKGCLEHVQGTDHAHLRVCNGVLLRGVVCVTPCSRTEGLPWG